MCTLTQMEQPTDMGCRTALFEVPWARSWKWLGPDLVPSLTTYQVLWCSGGTHCGGNQIMKPWWWLQYCDFGDYIYIYIYLMVVHDHDPWVWWAQSMHSLYSVFFPWLIVKCCPRICFFCNMLSGTIWEPWDQRIYRLEWTILLSS